MKTIMRYILLSAISTMMVCASTSAQQLPSNYDDLYKHTQGLSKEQAYDWFSLYQKAYPHHANTYFQLGEICLKWISDIDPLTRNGDMRYMAHNANVYYGLANLYVTAKDVRQNREYYAPVKPTAVKSIELEEVKAFLKKRMENVTEYTETVNRIYDNFSKSVTCYNRCVDLFRIINNENENIKDVYLTVDDEFMKNVNSLESSFDSTLHFFKAYKELTEKQPIKDYNQKYELKNIETFRLDGLTNANFLNNHFELWNYGQWVKELRTILNDEIAPLRKSIADIERGQNEMIEKLRKTTTFADSYTPFVMQPKQENQINRYDYQSMMLALFRYKQASIETIQKMHTSINNPATTNTAPLDKRGWFCLELTRNKFLSDSLYKAMQASITKANIQKHAELVAKSYGDAAKMKTYMQGIQDYIAQHYGYALETYKEYAVRQSNIYVDAPVGAMFRSTNLPMRIEPVALVPGNAAERLVKDVRTLESGNAYVTGSVKSGDTRTAFVAYVKGDAEVWNKTIDIDTKKMIDCGMTVLPRDSGCFAVVTSVAADDPSKIVNTLVSFDNAGKELGRYTLQATNMPRYLLWDDISEKLLAVFYGNSEVEAATSEIDVYQLSSTGTTEWLTHLTTPGILFDVVRVNADFMLFVNVPGATSSVQSFLVNAAGQLQKTVKYKTPQSVYGLRAVKVTSNSINVIGQTGTAPNLYRLNPSDGRAYYLLVKATGEQEYSNTDLWHK